LLLRYAASKGQLDQRLSAVTLKFFTEKLNNIALKLSHVVDDLRLSSYTVERVPILLQACGELSERIGQLSKSLQQHTAERAKFDSLGQQFQRLLKEYKNVQSAIKENEWRFQKFGKAHAGF